MNDSINVTVPGGASNINEREPSACRPLAWRRTPSDGTSYVYWALGPERPCDGGFLIESKPRFPDFGYRLYVPDQFAFIPGYAIRFRRLADAKAAARLPDEQLREQHRQAVRVFAECLPNAVGRSIEQRIDELRAKAGLPCSRASVEEWPRREGANETLETSNWTQRSAP